MLKRRNLLLWQRLISRRNETRFGSREWSGSEAFDAALARRMAACRRWMWMVAAVAKWWAVLSTAFASARTSKCERALWHAWARRVSRRRAWAMRNWRRWFWSSTMSCSEPECECECQSRGRGMDVVLEVKPLIRRCGIAEMVNVVYVIDSVRFDALGFPIGHWLNSIRCRLSCWSCICLVICTILIKRCLLNS